MNFFIINYKNNDYCIIDLKNNIPLVIDYKYFDLIKKYIDEEKIIYFNKNVYIKNYNNSNKNIILSKIIMNEFTKKIYHKNKLKFDNRLDNLTFINDKSNNNEKKRYFEYNNKRYLIPKYIYYQKESDTHGEKFYITINNIKFFSSSSKKLSIIYKFEEIKKFINELLKIDSNILNSITINNYLNKESFLIKKDLINIVKINNNYNVDKKEENNNKKILKNKLNYLTKEEKKLLNEKKFNLTKYINQNK